MKNIGIHINVSIVIRSIPAVVLMCIMAVSAICQPALQFSQYYSNQLVLNPAYAGSDNALSLTMVHRNQWSGVKGAPKTTTLSAHTLFKNEHTGLGINFFVDQINIHKNVNLSGIYSYRIKTGDHSFLSLGLQAGLYHINSDYTSLGSGSLVADDPGIGYENLSKSAFQFGTGIFFKNRSIELGISAPILYSTNIDFMNDESFLGTSPHIFMLARYKIRVSPNFQLNPGFLIKNNPGWPLSYDFNLDSWIKEVLMLAVSYRSYETLSCIVQVKILPQMKFGYSVDFPINESQARNFNTHEFMLNYIFTYKNYNVKSPR